ncbi:MAG: protein kinase [Planctomycetia bacterium]|nr:protein kinase [Planctomycetia bacterium]
MSASVSLRSLAQGLDGPELAALVRADQRRRWNRRDRVRSEQYLAEFPSLNGDENAVLDLICNEIQLSEEAGQSVNAQDFILRFPGYERQITRQLDLRKQLAQSAADSPGETIASSPGVPVAEIVGEFEEVPIIAGYEMIRELGRGGMGVVYQAKQTALDRVVALKMIRAGVHAGGEERLRFRIEAEAVARLRHANIVQVYEVGEADGRPYIALEYLDGGSLETKLENQPLKPRDAAQLLAVVARGMHAAHLRGIVHRDLKPANILLAADGTPKIADFGLAKKLDAVRQTQTGVVMGTPSHMSPEQARGAQEIGPATDVYGLGAILYEMLTGRPPFDGGNSVETLLQVMHRDPDRPSSIRPHLPRDLETICLKCLEKQPEKRYLTALELAEDLERFLRHEPIQARPIRWPERTWRWCRRQPGWATLAASLILTLIGGVVGWVWFTHRTMAARHEAEVARNDLRDSLTRATAERIDSDLRQLALAPRLMAAALQVRADWTEEQLAGWVRIALQEDARLFGMCVAFEPSEFRADRRDYALYLCRGEKGIEEKQLLPPDYVPLYREWPWYQAGKQNDLGVWSEPYVDDGGGNVTMVTFTVPFRRNGKLAGVVTADLALSYFTHLRGCVDEYRVCAHGHGFLVSKQGVILSHPAPACTYPSPGADLKKRPDLAALFEHFQSGKSGSFAGADFTTGQPVTYCFAPVPSSAWVYVAAVPSIHD